MKHPMTLAERVKANPFDTNKPMFSLWDKFGDKAEARIFKVMEECYAVQGKKPGLIRVETLPQNHPNPLVHMLRQLEKFALPIEIRDEFYRLNYKRNINDPEQRKEYETSKRAEKCYEKLFLTIWAEGLAEKWKPSEPSVFYNDFKKENPGLQDFLSSSILNTPLEDDFTVSLERAIIKYFGSKDRYIESLIKFYDKKVDELGMGAE